ncbi:MAG: hypothetical protein AABZ33_08755 [Chloroflexota bacterium]
MRALALLAGLLVGASSVVPITLARLTDTVDASATATTDTLTPPTGLGAVGGLTVVLSWTPTTDTYASGYYVERAPAAVGPYAMIATVNPSSATGSVDLPGVGTFYYRLAAYYNNWTSAYTAVVSATVIATDWKTCASNGANAGGDNNGFEGTPGNACIPGSPAATDVNSGTNTNTGCLNAGKDRHRFWDFTFGIPAVVTSINGIEVRLDAAVNNATGTNRMCARLSWDGGVTWTATKRLTALTTSIATYVLGGPVDTWGRAWAGAEFSDTNFRVQVIDVSSNNARDFTLEYMAVSVYYVP